MPAIDWERAIPILISTVSLAVSCIALWRQRREARPWERPSLSVTSVEPGLLVPVMGRTFGQTQSVFTFKNIGKHPADEVRLRAGVVDLANPSTFTTLLDSDFVNSVPPDGTFPWKQTLGARAADPGDGSDSQPPTAEVFLVLLLDYRDGWRGKRKQYHQEYYYVYHLPQTLPCPASNEQLQSAKPYIEGMTAES